MEVGSRGNTRRLLALAAYALLAVLALAVLAPDARADASQDARALFDRGVEASRAERWQEARILFERSLALVVKPSTLLNLAITNIKLGHGAEAIAQLDAFERVATPEEHGDMLERSRVLRAQARALVEHDAADASQTRRALPEARERNEEGMSEAARREVARAREHFARGDDREALAGFERAYADSPRPELLYNIGVVADRLREDERAIEAYESFARALPDAPEAAIAQVRSAALRRALAERRAAEAKKAAAEAERASAARARPVPSVSLTGPRAVLAVGTVLSAASLYGAAWVIERHIQYGRCRNPEPGQTCTTDPEELRRERNLVLGPTVALASVAITTTALGAVWLKRRKQEARGGRAQLEIAPQLDVGRSTLAVGLSGTF